MYCQDFSITQLPQTNEENKKKLILIINLQGNLVNFFDMQIQNNTQKIQILEQFGCSSVIKQILILEIVKADLFILFTDILDNFIQINNFNLSIPLALAIQYNELVISNGVVLISSIPTYSNLPTMNNSIYQNGILMIQFQQNNGYIVGCYYLDNLREHNLSLPYVMQGSFYTSSNQYAMIMNQYYSTQKQNIKSFFLYIFFIQKKQNEKKQNLNQRNYIFIQLSKNKRLYLEMEERKRKIRKFKQCLTENIEKLKELDYTLHIFIFQYFTYLIIKIFKIFSIRTLSVNKYNILSITSILFQRILNTQKQSIYSIYKSEISEQIMLQQINQKTNIHQIKEQIKQMSDDISLNNEINIIKEMQMKPFNTIMSHYMNKCEGHLEKIENMITSAKQHLEFKELCRQIEQKLLLHILRKHEYEDFYHSDCSLFILNKNFSGITHPVTKGKPYQQYLLIILLSFIRKSIQIMARLFILHISNLIVITSNQKVFFDFLIDQIQSKYIKQIQYNKNIEFQIEVILIVQVLVNVLTEFVPLAYLVIITGQLPCMLKTMLKLSNLKNKLYDRKKNKEDYTSCVDTTNQSTPSCNCKSDMGMNTSTYMCFACSSNCDTCTSGTVCTKCNDGYYLNSNAFSQ